MFLLAGIFFHVENLLQGFVEGLYIESLVLHHNFWAIKYAFVLAKAAYVLFHFRGQNKRM